MLSKLMWLTSKISFCLCARCECVRCFHFDMAKRKNENGKQNKTREKNDPWFMQFYLSIFPPSYHPLTPRFHYLFGADCRIAGVFFLLTGILISPSLWLDCVSCECLDSCHAYRLLTRIFFYPFFLTLYFFPSSMDTHTYSHAIHSPATLFPFGRNDFCMSIEHSPFSKQITTL